MGKTAKICSNRIYRTCRTTSQQYLPTMMQEKGTDNPHFIERTKAAALRKITGGVLLLKNYQSSVSVIIGGLIESGA